MQAAEAARPLPRLRKLLLRERDATAVTPPRYRRTRGFSPGRGERPAAGLTLQLGRGEPAVRQKVFQHLATARELPHSSCDGVTKHSATRQKFEYVFAVGQLKRECQIGRHSHSCRFR